MSKLGLKCLYPFYRTDPPDLPGKRSVSLIQMYLKLSTSYLPAVRYQFNIGVESWRLVEQISAAIAQKLHISIHMTVYRVVTTWFNMGTMMNFGNCKTGRFYEILWHHGWISIFKRKCDVESCSMFNEKKGLQTEQTTRMIRVALSVCVWLFSHKGYALLAPNSFFVSELPPIS